MSKAIVNFIVDAMAFVAFVFLIATGVLMRYVLPPGSGHFRTLWGMDRHGWGQVHFWIAVVLMGVFVVHLLLHWRWVVSTVRGRPREGSGVRVALAIVGLAALAAMAVAPFLAEVEQTGAPPHKMHSAEHPDNSAGEINGSMTLDEVAQRTGVSAEVILKELGLPSEVTTDEQLGRLRRQHGFEMHDVRRIVEKHLEPR